MLERKVSKEVSRIILQNQKQALEKAKHHVNAYGESYSKLEIVNKAQSKISKFFTKIIKLINFLYHG